MRTNNRISIRTVRQSDVGTLAKWGNGSPELWGSEESKWYTLDGLKQYLKALGDDIFLVAECGGELIGMCHARYMQEWIYWENLLVEKRFRKRGVAKKLFEQMVKKCKKKKGVREIGLQVRNDNLEAQAFYRQMGFREGFHYIWMEKDFVKRRKL